MVKKVSWCRTYALGFIKNLARLRKPLQQKLKKEVSRTRTLAIEKFFKTSKDV